MRAVVGGGLGLRLSSEADNGGVCMVCMVCVMCVVCVACEEQTLGSHVGCGADNEQSPAVLGRQSIE